MALGQSAFAAHPFENANVLFIETWPACSGMWPH